MLSASFARWVGVMLSLSKSKEDTPVRAAPSCDLVVGPTVAWRGPQCGSRSLSGGNRVRLRLLPSLTQQAQDVQCPSDSVLLFFIVAWRL